jgi:BirA family biotin operon repressor/biotin-[acetyl-CoA-carboxylase] ligase
MVAGTLTNQVDGIDAAILAAEIGVARIDAFDAVGSTMDEAHRLGEAGAPDGTVVVARTQESGRGRLGKKWTSGAGEGLWLTLLTRSTPVSGLDVLSVRIGLQLAPKLDRFASEELRVKWPNDLLIRGRKVAGILVEARWRDTHLEWVAIGIGINIVPPPEQPAAAGLCEGLTRSALLREVVPAIAAASHATGDLSTAELMAWASRDSARDARLTEPVAGVARGITSNGALIVETPEGRKLFRRGSLVHASENG